MTCYRNTFAETAAGILISPMISRSSANTWTENFAKQLRSRYKNTHEWLQAIGPAQRQVTPKRATKAVLIWILNILQWKMLSRSSKNALRKIGWKESIWIKKDWSKSDFKTSATWCKLSSSRKWICNTAINPQIKLALQRLLHLKPAQSTWILVRKCRTWLRL